MNNTYTSPKGAHYILGYYEKLKYWTAKYTSALRSGDPIYLKRAVKKLDYFTAKHIEFLNAID